MEQDSRVRSLKRLMVLALQRRGNIWIPRGSIYTSIRELGPKVLYYRRNFGSQLPSGCICGPSGIVLKIMGPFWLHIVLRHLIFRGTKMGP